MALSMTGFGRGEASSGALKFTVEIRSVNHRFCDVSIRIPRTFSYLEDLLRQIVLKKLSRGKVDVFVNFEEVGERERAVSTDIGLVKAYIEAAESIKSRFSIKDGISLSDILHLPDVFRVSSTDPGEAEASEPLERAARMALDALVGMRAREGEKLVGDIREKIGGIASLLAEIETRAPNVVSEYREKLNARLAELLGQNVPDESRVAAEIAIFADRCSIDEEITRFKSHLAQAAKCCSSGEPIGRKLDFILQEINREINTIGSKSNDMVIGEKVVGIKSEAEKIREQIQNLE